MQPQVDVVGRRGRAREVGDGAHGDDLDAAVLVGAQRLDQGGLEIAGRHQDRARLLGHPVGRVRELGQRVPGVEDGAVDGHGGEADADGTGGTRGGGGAHRPPGYRAWPDAGTERGVARVATATTLLAAASGVVDLWAVTSLGGPFAGVVTGNLVTVGGAAGRGDATALWPPLIAVLGFALGAAALGVRLASASPPPSRGR